MRPARRTLVIGLGLILLAGCATPYGRASSALERGSYEEAVTRFQEILGREPNRLDALVGLGVASYKLGAYDRAIEALTRAATQAPGSQAARLYLGLGHLQKGQDKAAEEQLTAFLALRPNPRIARQVERALALLRGETLSAGVRAFVAAALDDEAEWERDVRRAEENVAPFAPYPPGFWGLGTCFVSRYGYLYCY